MKEKLLGRSAKHTLSALACLLFMYSGEAQDSSITDVKRLLHEGRIADGKLLATDIYFRAKQDEDDQLAGHAAYWIANSYQEERKFTTSSKYYEEALDYAEITQDSELQLSINTSYSMLFSEFGNVAEAINRARSVLRIANETADQKHCQAAHEHLAYTFLSNGMLDSAYAHYRKSLHLSEDLRDSMLIAASLHNMGTALLNMGDLENARNYYEKSIGMYKVTGQTERVVEIYGNLLLIDQSESRTEKNILYATLGISIVFMLIASILGYRAYSKRVIIAERADFSSLKLLFDQDPQLALTYLYLAHGHKQKDVATLINKSPSLVNKQIKTIEALLNTTDVLEHAKSNGITTVPIQAAIKFVNNL